MLVSVVLLLCVPLLADSFVLTGNYLQVGVSNSGGLIDDAGTVGVRFDPSGTGTFNAQDFLLPGVPWEGYSLGEALDPAAGYDVPNGLGNPFNMVTTDTSAGSTLSAESIGFWAQANLNIIQELSFDTNSNTINFDVEFFPGVLPTEIDPDIPPIAYARFLDPDQDVNLAGGTYSTLNTIPSATEVVAVGPITGWYIKITDLTGGGVPSIQPGGVPGPSDPFVLFLGGNAGNGDHEIAMAWGVPLLFDGIGPAQDNGVHIRFSYEFGVQPIPEPCTMSLLAMGAVGLLGLRRRTK